MDALLPRDLIGAVVSKVGTAKQLCTILQLCKSWRAALTGQELEAIWERWVRREYPRAVAILDLTAPNVTMASWRDVYRDQLRAEAANAVNFTNALAFTDRLDSYVFTVEMRLDGELKASWMGKGPDIRIDEFTTELGCIIGGQARLWTSPPVWYSEVVQQPNQFNHSIGWDGRLELTLFVSRNTAQGLRCIPGSRFGVNCVTKSALSCFAPLAEAFAAEAFTSTSMTSMETPKRRSLWGVLWRG